MFAPRKATWMVRHGVAALTIGGLTSCANPGPPKPPSLHLPKLATGLVAERVGDQVLLNWTIPAGTTDGGTPRAPLTAILCRQTLNQELAVPPPPVGCTPGQRIPVQPGLARAADPLPPELRRGPARLLAYRVELLNSSGRSAGYSAPAFAAAGEAPPAITSFTSRPTRNGAVLSWAPAPDGIVEVTRTRSPAATASQPSPRQKPAKGSFAVNPARNEPAILTTGTTQDPGGMVDRGIQDGDTVVYTAGRVRRVELRIPAFQTPGKDGRTRETPASLQTFVLRGEPSAAITFGFHDVIPPNPPVGLAAVPGGGFGQPGSIDLSWEANPEEDIAGYNVYRTVAADAAKPRRLNDTLVPGPAFRDATAVPGVHYLYWVTAVDRRNHESAPGASIAVQQTP